MDHMPDHFNADILGDIFNYAISAVRTSVQLAATVRTTVGTMNFRAVYSFGRLTARTLMAFFATGFFTSWFIILVRLDKNRLLSRRAGGIINLK